MGNVRRIEHKERDGGRWMRAYDLDDAVAKALLFVFVCNLGGCLANLCKVVVRKKDSIRVFHHLFLESDVAR